MKEIIYILRDYPEAVIFLSLIGIFMTGVYFGKLITTNNYERGNK